MIREKIYEYKNWKGVLHTTWNPKGPGVIRIHMIPPKFYLFRVVDSAVLLNGQEILPIGESWAILLTEFINHVNAFGPHEMNDEELAEILDQTFYGVRKVYPDVEDEVLRRDLATIMSVFEDVARGRFPEIEIGRMSIGEYAPYMTAPHRMDLMVSAMAKNGKWHCNQKCLHCYAAGQTLAEAEELSTEEWKQIIKKCRKAGIPQLTFTGGEPTLRADLCELIASARWFVTRLNTNGVLLSEELCQGLAEAELDSVQITFYSNEEKIQNRLVGAERYHDTVAGIKNAIAAGLNLSINTPLCTLNKNYVETLRFLHELGVEYVTCSGLITTGNALENASVETQLKPEELYQILKEAVEYCHANGMEINFTSPGWIEEERLRALGLDIPSCGACLSNMAIAPDGKVIPCQSWLGGENYGDMRTTAWKKIWNHTDCKRRREYSAKMYQKCPLRKGDSCER